MSIPSSARFAGCSAALALAATLAPSPSHAQETVWQQAASRAAGPLAAELAKAFPGIGRDGDGAGDYMRFVATLKAAGLGKPQEPTTAGPGGGEGGEVGRAAGRFVAAELFKQLDADGDGTVAVEELPGEMKEHAHDVEGAEDGKLTLDELEPLVVEMRRREGGEPGRRGGGRDAGAADIEFAASLDTDRDGEVTLAELRAAIEAGLAKGLEGKASLDTDGSGTISKKEYAISMPYKFGEIDEHGMDGHARGHFKQEDLDEDGELSFEEVVTPVVSRTTGRIRVMQLAARLASADADQDGTLRVEELQSIADGDVAGGASPWNALGFGAGAVPVDLLYGTLARLPGEDATALDRLLR